VDQTDISQIVCQLREKHPAPAGECDLSDLELALGLLPDLSVWRVADLTPAVFALAPGDRLFTITLGPPPEPGSPCSVALLLARIGHAVSLDRLSVPGEFTAHSDLHAPGGSKATAPAPSVPSGPSRQQVTDIWGRPIDKRRGWRR